MRRWLIDTPVSREVLERGPELKKEDIVPSTWFMTVYREDSDFTRLTEVLLLDSLRIKLSFILISYYFIFVPQI